MKRILTDPISIMAIEIYKICNDYNVDKQVRESFQQMISNVRCDIGNKTWYIQKNIKKWDYTIELWEQVYEIRVKNRFITKIEALQEIAREITSITGEDVKTFTIEHIIKQKEQHKEKILKKKGLYQEDELEYF